MKKFLAGFISAIMLSGVAFAVADWTEVSAILRPGISIYMDGKKMDYKDANGNSVAPVIIDGSTYLPLRGLVNSMGKAVNWNESTQTITIGEAMPTSLLDATGNIIGNAYEKVVGEHNLSFPNIGDVGVKYTSAIKSTNNNSATNKGIVSLNDAYNTLETSLLGIPVSGEPSSLTFKIFNDETNVMLLDRTINPNQVSQVSVNITGVKKLRFETSGKVSTNATMYFLNPIVK